MDDWKQVLVSLSELVKKMALQQAYLMAEIAALRATVLADPETRAAYEIASANGEKQYEETIRALTEICDSILALARESGWKN